MDEPPLFAEDEEPIGTSADWTSEPTQNEDVGDFVDRLKCIADHRSDLGDATRAGVAALRHVTADLMDVEAIIGSQLIQALSTGNFQIENIEQFSPVLNFLLRFAKLISQTKQVELRYQKQGFPDTPGKPNPR